MKFSVESAGTSDCSGTTCFVSSNKSIDSIEVEEINESKYSSSNDETESLDSDQKLRTVRKWTPEEVTTVCNIALNHC